MEGLIAVGEVEVAEVGKYIEVLYAVICKAPLLLNCLKSRGTDKLYEDEEKPISFFLPTQSLVCKKPYS